MLSTLDRLITDTSIGDSAATDRLQTWSELRSKLVDLGFDIGEDRSDSPQGFLKPFYHLQKNIDEMQQALGSDQGFSKLTANLASGDAEFSEWFSSAVENLLDLTRAFEPQRTDNQVQKSATPVADESDRMRSALNKYLGSRYPELTVDPITSFQLTPGGHVKQMVIFSLVDNSSLPTRLVLRKDMPNSLTGTTVIDEYPYIEQAFKIGLPVPQPILLEPSADAIGGSFMLMTEIKDASAAGAHFPEERLEAPLKIGPEFGKQVAQTLARLHSGTRVTATTALPDYPQSVKDALASWRQSNKAPFSVSTEMGLAWLLAHPTKSDRPWCMVHGDFGMHNFLVRDGQLAALVDWELAHPGDPAEDIAQCRMMVLPGVMDWEDFVAEYVAAGGDPTACDAEVVGYFCVWIFLNHAIMHATVRDKFVTGERTDIMLASIITHYHALMMKYQALSLKIAISSGQ